MKELGSTCDMCGNSKPYLCTCTGEIDVTMTNETKQNSEVWMYNPAKKQILAFNGGSYAIAKNILEDNQGALMAAAPDLYEAAITGREACEIHANECREAGNEKFARIWEYKAEKIRKAIAKTKVEESCKQGTGMTMQNLLYYHQGEKNRYEKELGSLLNSDNNAYKNQKSLIDFYRETISFHYQAINILEKMDCHT